MGLKKFLKKARKAIGLPPVTLGNVAKVAAATAIGGPAAGAATVLKSKLKSAAIGGIKQAVKSKAEKVLHNKIAKLTPKVAAASSKAQTMPGGAPLKRVATTARKAVTKAAKKRATKAAKAPGAKKRTPPKGGLDLKALSAKWKAAGKPGKWIDFVKANR